MNRIHITCFSLLILTACNSNSGKDTPPHKTVEEAIVLNNAAIVFMIKGDTTAGDKAAFYDSAVSKLDKAIALDPAYMLAYGNKAQVLRKLGQRDQSIAALKAALEIEPENFDALMALAFSYEKFGHQQLANETFEEASGIANRRVTKNEKDQKATIDRIFLHVFTDGKESAVREIDALANDNPNDPRIRGIQQVIHDFDRKTFIEKF